MSGDAIDGDHVSARFRIRLPGSAWIESVSTSFPTATFRLLAGVPTDRGAMHPGLTGPTPSLRRSGSTRMCSNTPNRTRRTTGPWLPTRPPRRDCTSSLKHAGVVPDYPVVVRNGWFTVDLTDTREAIRAIQDGLEAADVPFDLMTIGDPLDDDRLSTDR